MSHDSHDEEEVTLSVAAQLIADEVSEHEATISHASPGIHLELVDLSNGVPADDDWEFDLPADLGLKILIGGIEADVAAQILRAAADFLEEAVEEGDEDEG